MYTQGYQQAIKLLRQASTSLGFTAAVKEEDNYKRVWTRDSALCGLAALATEDQGLVDSFRLSIETIFKHQHPSGFIPSNVAQDGTVSYGGVVGRVDNHAWIIISACNYAFVTYKKYWLMQYEPAITKCLELMNAWEFNGKGLMYTPQSADWADEYYHHGYILYNQLLRLWALRCAAKMFDNEIFKAEAVRVQSVIEHNFQTTVCYAEHSKRQLKESFPYWLMGFNPSTVYIQFDLQANALALLLQIGTIQKRESLLSYLDSLLKQYNSMLPSFYPVIESSDQHMLDLQGNYAFRFRNFPHQFHNGGLWPVWNGLMASATSLYDSQMQQNLLQPIIASCSQNNWEFNECYEGETKEPCGVSHCAWSAAGLILAGASSLTKQLIV